VDVVTHKFLHYIKAESRLLIDQIQQSYLQRTVKVCLNLLKWSLWHVKALALWYLPPTQLTHNFYRNTLPSRNKGPNSCQWLISKAGNPWWLF